MSKLKNTPKTFRQTAWRALFIAIGTLGTSACIATAPKPDITIAQSLPKENISRSGWDYLEQGAYEAAIPAFHIALSKNPDDEKLRFGLAESLRYASRTEQAELQYAKLLQSPKYRIDALTGIGHIKLSNYDSQGAFQLFSEATTEDDTSWKAWLGLALLRDQANDWEAADEAYNLALASTNNRALVHNNHGISLLARGDAKMALVYFDMALAIDPESERVRTNIDLANAVMNGGLGNSKHEHLNGKEYAQKLNNWGYAAMLRGESKKAEEYFLKAIDAHPSFYAMAHKNLQTLKSTRK